MYCILFSNILQNEMIQKDLTQEQFRLKNILLEIVIAIIFLYYKCLRRAVLCVEY